MLIRALSRAARRAAERRVLRDLVSFRREARALRAALPRQRDEGTVLVISLSDFIYQVKLEGVLASALALRGYRPVVLTFKATLWAEPYFRAYGIDKFVYTDEFVSPERDEEVEAVVQEALRSPSVQTLKAFSFRGAHVGQQTLSTLSRSFQRGRISLDDADVRDVLPDVLRNSVRAVLGAEALLERLEPEIVLFNEKGYAGYGSVYDIALARGANVIQFVAAGIHWRDALLFKRYTEETRRLHPASLSDDSWKRVQEIEWDERHERELRAEFDLRYGGGEKHPDAGLQEGKRIKKADDVRRELGLDPAKPTAVIFSHVLWDANLFYGVDLFSDQEAWLVESVRAACRNPLANWVVKLHPANMYKAHGGDLNDEVAIREAVGRLPPHVKLLRPDTDINTYSLFDVADCGITIRGTIGMELPCFGVRVLTAGTGRYSGLGFTDDSATSEEYLEKLGRVHELPRLSADETLLAKKHAYGLFRLRPTRFTSYEAHFMPAERLGHPLSHNLRIRVRSPREVATASDLREFAAWALDRSRLDYLSEDHEVSSRIRASAGAQSSGASRSTR